jgi:tetratricopeptide (TPR) repeat protein
MFEHPTPEDLERFVRSASRPSGANNNARLIQHLLADCATCRNGLSALGWDSNRLDRLLRLPGTDENASAAGSNHHYNYNEAFASTARRIDEFFAVEQTAAQSPEVLLAELASLAESEQLRRAGNEPRFASPQLARWLVERSHASRYEDAEKMLHLALLAQTVADACSADSVGGERRLADLRSRAWGQLGNSLRVSGKLREAEEALATASRYCDAGTGDPPTRARLFEQLASLQIFQRNFGKATEMADEAGRIYRDLEETHQLASTLVQKAIASLYAGKAEQAVSILNRAIPLIDQEEDPHLLLAACHNMVHGYIDLDQPEQALALYFKFHELYKEFKDALILLRASWEEGMLLRDLGHLRAAETALLRARKGFMERGLAYEVAVVSLDLAAVYVKLGAVDELKQSVAETMPIFRSLRVGRETLASLIQLQQVADQEHQALELIRVVTTQLEHLPNRTLLK